MYVSVQVEDCGGAIEVEAGQTFCAILTRAGRVLLCGRLPDLPGMEPREGLSIMHYDTVPPVTQIAAGSKHLLMSGGEQVWTVGM